MIIGYRTVNTSIIKISFNVKPTNISIIQGICTHCRKREWTQNWQKSSIKKYLTKENTNIIDDFNAKIVDKLTNENDNKRSTAGKYIDFVGSMGCRLRKENPKNYEDSDGKKWKHWYENKELQRKLLHLSRRERGRRSHRRLQNSKKA